MILKDVDADKLRELLALYIRMVIDCEGCDFIENYSGHDFDPTPEQWELLERASNEAAELCDPMDDRLPWRKRAGVAA